MKKTRIKLFAVILFFVIINILVLAKDTTPLTYDAEGYFEQSINYYRIIFEGQDSSIDSLSRISEDRPPFFMLSTIPLYLTIGISEDAARMTNMVYLIILVVFTYLLGKKIANKKAGLVAAIIVPSIPLVFGFLRMYYTDFAGASLTAAFFYGLLKTENFNNTKWSIILGLTASSMLLTKKLLLIMIIGPVIYELVTKSFNKKSLKNLFLFAGIVILLAVPWYLLQKDYLLFWLGESTNISLVKNNIPILSLESMTYYLSALKDTIIYTPGSIILIFSFGYFLFNKNRYKYKILAWLVWVYISLSLIANKAPRYLLPLMPLLAIIIGCSATNTRKRAVTVFIIFFFFIQTLFISFSPKANFIVPHLQDRDLDETYNVIGLLQPQNKDYRIDELMELFPGKGERVLFMTMQGAVYSQISREATLNKKDIRMVVPFDYASSGFESCGEDNCSENYYDILVRTSDFIILSDLIEQEPEERIVKERLEESFDKHRELFNLSKKLPLPNNTTLLIYQKND